MTGPQVPGPLPHAIIMRAMFGGGGVSLGQPTGMGEPHEQGYATRWALGQVRLCPRAACPFWTISHRACRRSLSRDTLWPGGNSRHEEQGQTAHTHPQGGRQLAERDLLGRCLVGARLSLSSALQHRPCPRPPHIHPHARRRWIFLPKIPSLSPRRCARGRRRGGPPYH